jgi:hypothetical protein
MQYPYETLIFFFFKIPGIESTHVYFEWATIHFEDHATRGD